MSKVMSSILLRMFRLKTPTLLFQIQVRLERLATAMRIAIPDTASRVRVATSVRNPAILSAPMVGTVSLSQAEQILFSYACPVFRSFALHVQPTVSALMVFAWSKQMVVDALFPAVTPMIVRMASIALPTPQERRTAITVSPPQVPVIATLTPMEDSAVALWRTI